jgi:DNA-binding NarL/FixJ family response regulator
MLQILLADDHDITRQGIRCLLEVEQDWKVCAEARNGRDAVALAASSAPDVAILDMTMPELNGVEATRQIARVSPRTKILIFTMHDSEQLARDALAAGAQGYVLKTDPARDLVDAVAALSGGARFLSGRVSKCRGEFTRTRGGSANPLRSLTPREREITQLLAEGKTNWCISKILGISINTVETHRANIMHKLGLESIVELVHYAIRNDLVACGSRVSFTPHPPQASSSVCALGTANRSAGDRVGFVRTDRASRR